jgi:hypothetical protein
MQTPDVPFMMSVASIVTQSPEWAVAPLVKDGTFSEGQ